MNRPAFGYPRLLAALFGFALFVASALPALAQSNNSVVEYNPSTYNPGLGEFNEFLLGPGGEPQQQQEQEPIIHVKTGTKIFDAVEPHSLLYYKVNIVPIRISQYDPAKYSDDGINNGDEVPNDGMPSQIDIENSRYISIYSARNRDRMKTMKEKMVNQGPVQFFRLGAVSPDANVAAVAQTPDEREELQRFSATYWKERISSKVEEIDDGELARYEGFEVFVARDDMGLIIFDPDGQPYYDTTRPPEEVFEIVDGREKQRLDAMEKRDLKREVQQAVRDEKYSGNVASMNYIRGALGAQTTSDLRTQRMNELSGTREGGGQTRQRERTPRRRGSGGGGGGGDYGGGR